MSGVNQHFIVAISVAAFSCAALAQAPERPRPGQPGGSVALAPVQRQMEDLGRGVVAVKLSEGTVYVGWRLFGLD